MRSQPSTSTGTRRALLDQLGDHGRDLRQVEPVVVGEVSARWRRRRGAASASSSRQASGSEGAGRASTSAGIDPLGEVVDPGEVAGPPAGGDAAIPNRYSRARLAVGSVPHAPGPSPGSVSSPAVSGPRSRPPRRPPRCSRLVLRDHAARLPHGSQLSIDQRSSGTGRPAAATPRGTSTRTPPRRRPCGATMSRWWGPSRANSGISWLRTQHVDRVDLHQPDAVEHPADVAPVDPAGPGGGRRTPGRAARCAAPGRPTTTPSWPSEGSYGTAVTAIGRGPCGGRPRGAAQPARRRGRGSGRGGTQRWPRRSAPGAAAPPR